MKRLLLIVALLALMLAPVASASAADCSRGRCRPGVTVVRASRGMVRVAVNRRRVRVFVGRRCRRCR